MASLRTHPDRVKQPIVVLTTDFGTADPFVGIMKGVILSICPAAVIVDLTHGIPPQDVLVGCLALEAACPFFPAGAIHVCVVDPGVGTDRRAVLVRTRRGSFIAPDNGLLSFLEPAEIQEIRALENPRYFLQPLSQTFHGRDVFAPVAGHLASGVKPRSFGEKLHSLTRLQVPRASCSPSGIEGEVLYFDHFGNAITSFRAGDLPPNTLEVRMAERRIPLVHAYASVPPGTVLALVGSSGRVEIAVSRGSARGELGLSRGDLVHVAP